MQAKPSVRIPQCLFWGLFTGLMLGLYSPMLVWGQIPAFRDAFHFYYPFEVWLVQQAGVGEWLPQYNPFDGTGINTVGESSGYLFYPLRFLWWIPWLTVPQRLGLFLLVHNFIAAIGAAYAAKRMGLSHAAMALAAGAYSLSGPVLFQHTNPVYLIGAAWLPWAFAELIVLAVGTCFTGHSASNRSAESLRTIPAPRLGIVVGATSLMVLGGDPQAALHAGLIALLAWSFRSLHNRRSQDCLRSLIWLAQVGLLVMGLTCIQWLPTLLWLQQSNRFALAPTTVASLTSSVEDLPPLIEDVLVDLSNKDRLSQPPVSTYDYSVAPWHLLTLIWSTAGGHAFPEHSRWLQSFAAEPRMWCPSLSVGLLPALLVTLGWRWRSASRQQRFVFSVCLFAAAAMLGDYTLIWLLRQALNLCGARAWAARLPSDQVSGLYWILTECVPFYGAFRYPAKWSVWFVCAMSLCAAVALDGNGLLNRLQRVVCGLTLLTLAMLAVVTCLPVQWQDRLATWLAAAPSDPWLGSPTYAAVRTQWTFAISTALVVHLALLTTLILKSRIPSSQLRWMWVLLTIIELGVASGSWIVVRSAPSAETLQAHWQEAPLAPATAPMHRIWSGVGRADFNSQFIKANLKPFMGQAHYQQVCAFEERFYLGKLHLLESNRGNVAAFTSLTPRALAAMRQRLSQADTLARHNPELDRALAWLGVSHRLTLDDRFHWCSIPNAAPLIEWKPATPASSKELANPSQTLMPTLLDFDSDDFTLKLNAVEPGMLVVRLLQDGGWHVRLVPSDSPANPPSNANAAPAIQHLIPTSTHLGLFQTLNVPAGEWVAYWQYECPGLRLGAIITLATAGTCLAGFASLSRFFRKTH